MHTWRGSTGSHSRKGQVALVLGAGNVNAIAPLDTLYKLYAEGQVVLLKLNPVNDYLGPILEETFAPFISAGFLRIASGGADVGVYLTTHELVDTIHVTGSARTLDAIVFGSGPEGVERKRRRTPLLTKPITQRTGGRRPLHRGPRPVERGGPPVPGGEHRHDEAPQQRVQLRGGPGARAAAALERERPAARRDPTGDALAAAARGLLSRLRRAAAVARWPLIRRRSCSVGPTRRGR